MRRALQLAVLVSLITIIGGCSVGRDFVRPEFGSLILGETTYHEILERFGTPREEGSVTKNDAIMKTVTYGYSSTGAKPLVDGVTPARGLTFSFLDNQLVGYIFTSSFSADHTEFDESKLNRIKKGQTNRAGLIELIGQPGGMQKYPLTKSKEDEVLVWQYVHVKQSVLGLKPYAKTLGVTVGTDNIVKDLEFSTMGEK